MSSSRVIICQYPTLYLTSLNGAVLCKDHMLEYKIDGGCRVDSCRVLFKNAIEYTVTHIQYCVFCEQEGKGCATKKTIQTLSTSFYLNFVLGSNVN